MVCETREQGVWTQAKAMAEAAQAVAAKVAVPSAPPSRRKGKKRKGCRSAPQKEVVTALDSPASVPPGIHEFDEQLEKVGTQTQR